MRYVFVNTDSCNGIDSGHMEQINPDKLIIVIVLRCIQESNIKLNS